ncbi:MAG TPA: hypothetical protein VKP65_05525 [Rhodothermales bacterium]|nr:hypothetical protein [Rhodothermales bacterium]
MTTPQLAIAMPHALLTDDFLIHPGPPRPLPLIIGTVQAGFPSPGADHIE